MMWGMESPGALAGATGAQEAVKRDADTSIRSLAHSARQSASSHRERDDAYSRVVAILAPRWRVIVCKDAIQWIIQHQDAAGTGPGRWRNVVYFRTRAALTGAGARLAGPLEPSALAALAALPETFAKGVRHG